MNRLQTLVCIFGKENQNIAYLKMDLALIKYLTSPNWAKALAPCFEMPYFIELASFLQKERAAHKIIFPALPQVFEALNLCDLNQVKVVIIGQDPYHHAGQANGLAFSVSKGQALPPSLKNIFKELKNDQFIIVSAEYRLSPKVHAPAFIEDAAASVAWVFNNIHQFGGDTSKIFLSGHSAGGYLAMMLTIDESWLLKQNISNNRIKACIPLSPQVITHFTIRAENNIINTQPVIDKYAPMNFIKANTPVIIDITGDRELELLGRYEENAYFVRMMKLAGNKNISLYELQGFSHGSMNLPGIHLMYQEIDKILNKK